MSPASECINRNMADLRLRQGLFIPRYIPCIEFGVPLCWHGSAMLIRISFMSLAFVCVRVRVWNDESGNGSVFLVACVAFCIRGAYGIENAKTNHVLNVYSWCLSDVELNDLSYLLLQACFSGVGEIGGARDIKSGMA